MAQTRYAFVKANWHADIVSKLLDGFLQLIRPHEHEAERVLARQLELSGGKMTDELERQVMEIIMRNRLYSR
jgi:hypothetical protein